MDFKLLDNFLDRYSEFSIKPITGNDLNLVGHLNRMLNHEAFGYVNINFSLLIKLPLDFPNSYPRVYETGGLINPTPSNHINPDGSFCLGSPLQLKIVLKRSSDFLHFFDNCILPYLYAVSLNIQKGQGFPFGELGHGKPGLILDFQNFFGLRNFIQVSQMLKILSSRKKTANKMICPCGCSKRVTNCNYFKTILQMRRTLTRVEWEEQLRLLSN